MRAILGLMLAMGFTTAASAQDMVQNPDSQIYIPTSVPGQVSDYRNAPLADGAGGYEEQVMQLKRRVERLTQKDGGELTTEHVAMLERELRQLNRQYGKDRPPRRSTF